MHRLLLCVLVPWTKSDSLPYTFERGEIRRESAPLQSPMDSRNVTSVQPDVDLAQYQASYKVDSGACQSCS